MRASGCSSRPGTSGWRKRPAGSSTSRCRSSSSWSSPSSWPGSLRRLVRRGMRKFVVLSGRNPLSQEAPEQLEQRRRHPRHGVVEHRGRARLRSRRLVDPRDPRGRRESPRDRERLRRRRARLRRAADRQGRARRFSHARGEPVRRRRHHRDRRCRKASWSGCRSESPTSATDRARSGTSRTATSACSATSRRSTRPRCSTWR